MVFRKWTSQTCQKLSINRDRFFSGMSGGPGSRGPPGRDVSIFKVLKLCLSKFHVFLRTERKLSFLGMQWNRCTYRTDLNWLEAFNCWIEIWKNNDFLTYTGYSWTSRTYRLSRPNGHSRKRCEQSLENYCFWNQQSRRDSRERAKCIVNNFISFLFAYTRELKVS